MPRLVYGPDNKIYEFPDDTRNDQIEQFLNDNFKPEQPQLDTLKYEDNRGFTSYFQDIIDRGKALDESIELYNQLQDIDPETNPELWQQTQTKFQAAVDTVNQYTHTKEDNWFTTLGKDIAADTIAVLGAGTAGGLAGLAAGGVGAPIGAIAGAFTVGFERSRRTNKVFNAYRELMSSGDLTANELDEAGKTAIQQAMLEGGVDAATAGLAGVFPKVAKSLLKGAALNAAGGAVAEVGSSALQRAYVSNLDLLGEDAVAEYLEAAATGAFAQSALGAGFHTVQNVMQPKSKQEILDSQVDNQQIKQIVDQITEAETEELARERLRIILGEDEASGDLFANFEEQTVKEKVDKIQPSIEVLEEPKKVFDFGVEKIGYAKKFDDLSKISKNQLEKIDTIFRLDDPIIGKFDRVATIETLRKEFEMAGYKTDVHYAKTGSVYFTVNPPNKKQPYIRIRFASHGKRLFETDDDPFVVRLEENREFIKRKKDKYTEEDYDQIEIDYKNIEEDLQLLSQYFNQRVKKDGVKPQKGKDATSTLFLYEDIDQPFDPKIDPKERLRIAKEKIAEQNLEITPEQLIKEEDAKRQRVRVKNAKLQIFPKKNMLQLQRVDAEKNAIDVYRKAAKLASERGLRLASKSSLSIDEYRNFKQLIKDGIKLRENSTVKRQGDRYIASNKLPMFVATSYPQNIQVAQRTKKQIQLKPRLELFQENAKRDETGARIQEQLEKVFNKPSDLVALRTIPNEALVAFSKTPEYKRLVSAKDAVLSKQIFDHAANNANVATALVDNNVPPSAINDGNIQRTIAKGIQELKQQNPELNNIVDFAKRIDDLEKMNPNPTTQKSFVEKLSKLLIFHGALLDPQTLMRIDPEVAHIGNYVLYRNQFRDYLSGIAMNNKKQLQKTMKQDGTWDAAHDALDNLDKYNGKLENGQYSWTHPETGKRTIYSKDFSLKIADLNDYYNTKLNIIRSVYQDAVTRLNELGDVDAAKEYVDRLKKIDDLLAKPHFPRRRFGDLWVKVPYGDAKKPQYAMFALEEVKGVDKLNKPDLLNIGNNIFISRREFDALRGKVREQFGKEILGQFYNKNNQIPDLVFFRRNRNLRLNNSDFDHILAQEEIMNLLSETDSDKLHRIHGEIRGETFDRLIQPSRKIEGYSKDYDRLADSSAQMDMDNVVNLLMEPVTRKIVERYSKGKDAATLAEKFFNRIFKPESEVSNNFAVIQAMLGLGASLSTAILQFVTPFSTLPASLSTMSNNPATLSKYISSGFGFATKMLPYLDKLSDRETLTKVTGGDKPLVDAMIRNASRVGHSPRQDFRRSFANKNRPVSKVVNTVEDGAFWMLTTAEKITRLAGFHATFKMAQNPKYRLRARKALQNDPTFNIWNSERGEMTETEMITNILLDNSYAIYGQFGRAGIQQGVGRILMPFATYPLQVTNTMIKLMKGMNGTRAQVGAFSVIAGMALMFGMQGAPFYELVELLYKLWGKIIGQNKDMTQEAFDALYEIDPNIARFMKRGFVGELMGIDFSKRVSLGNPYSSFTSFLTDDSPVGRDIGFLLPKLHEVKMAAQNGDGGQLISAIMPNAINNMKQALIDWDEKGVATKYGTVLQPNENISDIDRAKKFFGFNPMSISNLQSAYYSGVIEKNKYTPLKKRLIRQAYPEFKKWVESGKTDARAKQRVVDAFKQYRQAFEDNGDVFTRDKVDGFEESLKRMYMNEVYGFAGGETKGSLSREVVRKAQGYYEQLEGNE